MATGRRGRRPVAERRVRPLSVVFHAPHFDHHLRRLLRRVRVDGDRGVVHRLRGRPSNRKIPAALQGRILAQARRRYADFGPTLASEHLARDGWQVSRETLRQIAAVVGCHHQTVSNELRQPLAGV